MVGLVGSYASHEGVVERQLASADKIWVVTQQQLQQGQGGFSQVRCLGPRVFGPNSP